MTTVATGVSWDGDEWTLDAVPPPPGADVSGPLLLLSVVTPGGRRLGGGGGDWDLDDRPFATWSGVDDAGPRRLIVVVAPEVSSVSVTLSSGAREPLDLHGVPGLERLRVAVIVYPRQLDIHRLDLRDVEGHEVG